MARVTEIVVGGMTSSWERLGLKFSEGVAVIGSVRLRIDPSAAPGISSIGVDAVDAERDDLDGAPIHVAPPSAGAAAAAHGLPVSIIDHVVLMTPDLERTVDSVTAALGNPLKRIREAPPVRQGFFRLGEVILELVQSPQVPAGPARWWGLVINLDGDADDLATACDRLGPDVIGPPRPAVQPGRCIATVRDSLGLGLPVAIMST